jgi:UDP-perosamine 4-acetyltransferase
MRTDRDPDAPMIILGAGGHAKVAIFAIRSMGKYNIVGCVANDSSRYLEGVPVLGDDTILPRLRMEGIKNAFVAIGSNALRLELGKKLLSLGFLTPSVVSTEASVAPSASVGEGTVVMTRAVVHPAATVGRYCIINTAAIVEHDCGVGDGVHIAPNSVLCGGVTVGERTFICAGSTVIPGIEIGADAIVGAGSVVIRNVPDAEVHAGNPARLLRNVGTGR